MEATGPRISLMICSTFMCVVGC